MLRTGRTGRFGTLILDRSTFTFNTTSPSQVFILQFHEQALFRGASDAKETCAYFRAAVWAAICFGQLHDWHAIRIGVFSSDSPEINSTPMLRDGACGAPLVCITLGPVEGAVGWYFHWSDIPGYGRNLLCFCEPCNDLVGDGWVVSAA
ncbi:hypothetical protein BDD12DRAFT_863232 [Trichophaea hybrida]|nr:hypothetical protein BDD12DRAFT_863232 [Trichophaea hybrida]